MIFASAKHFFIAACCMIYAAMSAMAQEYWVKEFSPDTMAQAKKDSKNIMLFFTGSDWCPACRDFEQNILQSGEFDSYAKKELLCVRVDFPRLTAQSQKQKDGNGKLLDKLLGKETSFPVVVLLDPQGKRLGKIAGGRSPAQFIIQLDQLKNLPPVFQCVRDGDKDRLEKLFSQGADPSASTPATHISLLAYAICENASDDVIELILKAGAEKKIDEMTGSGINALCNAVMYGRPSTVKLLLKYGASPQIISKSGKQPLIMAIQSGSLKKVQILLDAGCHVNVCYDAKTGSPLHAAIREGNHEIIRVLLEKGAKPNAVDAEGNTPLHYAVILRDQKSVWLLIQAKADPQKKNKKEKTPWDLAKNNAAITKLLLGK